MSYDPINLGKEIFPKVCRKKGDLYERRIYRFRVDKWYGGILTADVVGCNLRCRFCWAWRTSSFRTDTGKFMSPYDVYKRIISMNRRTKINKARFSGGEPLLCPDHTLKTSSLLGESGIQVIIETNGLFIDRLKEIIPLLKKSTNTILRISIKGCNKKIFQRITGAHPYGFDIQLNVIKELIQNGFEVGKDFWVSSVISFCNNNELEELMKKLEEIDPNILDFFEPEYVILYPHVKELLEKHRIRLNTEESA